MASEYDLVIVGGGVAGLTAGMYGARYGLKTAIVERLVPCNQIINVERIENFPGFPQGISGAELGPRMQEQAMDAGAHFLMEDVTGLLLDNPYRMLTTPDSNHRAKALILAAGSSPRLWGYPVRRSLTAAGCLTVPPVMVLCFAARWWRGWWRRFGGGRGPDPDGVRRQGDTVSPQRPIPAQKYLQDRILRHRKIDVALNTVVESVLGEDRVTGVGVRNVITNLFESVDLSGLFVYVGLQPNAEFVRGVLKTDNAGHIPVDIRMETQVPGIFAAGDIRQRSVSQIGQQCW